MSWWDNALDAALEAAEQQFAVIPLSLSKLPAIKSPHDKGHGCKSECGQFGHGIHDATADPDRIRAMFQAAPHATGYAIACGRAPHHLIGLDLDVKDGVNGVAELRRLAEEHGFDIPRTAAVRTPSGGWHTWWAGPAQVKVPNRAGYIASGVDVRGSGGYLVGPGSRGKNGLYTFAASTDPGNLTVADIPESLLRLVTASKERPRMFRSSTAPTAGGNALVGLVRLVLDAQEGQRNSRLYWAAVKAAEHAAAGRLDPHAAERALIRAAVDTGLPESEAERTVASARGTTAGVFQ